MKASPEEPRNKQFVDPWGKCFRCGGQMIQGGDHDDESGDHLIVSNFHCPGCGSDALFFWR